MRYAFSRIGLVLGLVATVGCSSMERKPYTADFSPPHAYTSKNCSVEQQQTIITIRQAHWRTDVPEQYANDILSVQKEIAKLLTYLKPKSLYLEGVINGEEEAYLKQMKAITQLGTKSIRDATQGKISMEAALAIKAYSALSVDAATRQALRGRVQIRGGEGEAYQRYWELKRKGIEEENLEWLIFNAREEELLAHIIEDGEQVAYVIYGGLHDFSEEIEQWNAAHPEHQIGHIDITPASLPSLMARLEAESQ
jgi:hypothetical protein